MVDLLNFLQTNGNGFLILFLIFLGIGLLTHYAMWMFGRGRFAGAADIPKDKKLNFVIAAAAVKLIDDFRHLLALILVLIFSIVLGYAVYLGRGSMDNLKDGLQAVMATLGGLVGSIIGYYFGEARSSGQTGPPPPPPAPGQTTTTPSVQPPPGTEVVPGIEAAPLPPGIEPVSGVEEPAPEAIDE